MLTVTFVAVFVVVIFLLVVVIVVVVIVVVPPHTPIPLLEPLLILILTSQTR